MLNGPSNEADNTELKNIAMTVLIGKPDECRINNHRCRRQQQVGKDLYLSITFDGRQYV